MGKGSQSQNSTQQQTVPPWLSEGQQNLVGQSQDMTGPFLNVPQFRTAGFTPDQTNAFDLTRSMAMNAFTNPTQQVNGSGAYVSPAQMSAAQVTPQQIAQFQNPYNQAVIGATMNNLNNEKAIQGADIGARAAAAGAFGGSREAVQRSLLDKNTQNTAAQTIANLLSQGYGQATQTAMGNTNLLQQAMGQNASMAQQAALANAQTSLQIPQINTALQGQNQQQQINALTALMGTGGAQQQLAQQSLNVPWTTLQQLASIIGPSLNNTDKTVTGSTTSTGSAGATQMIGLIGSLLSACHVAGTKIRMEDGTFKNVEELENGDRVFLGGLVVGRGEVISPDIYDYKNTQINGRHAVFEDGRFVRVEDSKLATPIPEIEAETVYPIVTEHHVLVTENYICADFAEYDEDIGAEGRLAALNAQTERNRLLAMAEDKLFLKAAA